MEPEKLYEEMAHSAESIRELVADIGRDEARIKPSADAWSVLEVVCHLYDEEREDFRQRLDIILHRPTEPLPPIDTEGWVTSRHYNERDLPEMLEKFLGERRQSLAWLRGLTSPNWEAEYTTSFRVMKAGDMLASWTAHDNLAVRQLVELRRQRVLRLTAPYNVRYAGEW